MEEIATRPCPCCGSLSAYQKFIEPPFLIVKCPSCSLVYLGNPPKEDALYDEYYGVSNSNLTDYSCNSNDAGLKELYEINQQRLARIKLFKPKGRLLDIGCGRGQFLKSARDHGYQVQGIDVSERAVIAARKEFGLNVDLRSLEDVVASGEQFDIISLWHVLEHFSNPYEALRSISVLLKNGGICMIEVPNLYSMKFILSRTKWKEGNHPLYHRTFFSAITLKDALSQCGFEKVERLMLSYHIRGRSRIYENIKQTLNVLALDAFLDFVAWK